jgi:hypothetical protein
LPLSKLSESDFWSPCGSLFSASSLAGLFILRWTGSFVDLPYSH